MHVINQIVKGNLYFRFKTKRIISILDLLAIKNITIHWCKVIVVYEIRFQKFVDVDFFQTKYIFISVMRRRHMEEKCPF